jgi:hypothetical protein
MICTFFFFLLGLKHLVELFDVLLLDFVIALVVFLSLDEVVKHFGDYELKDMKRLLFSATKGMDQVKTSMKLGKRYGCSFW